MFTSFLVSFHTKGKKYVHFILKPLHTITTSFLGPFHTRCHFIPRVTSYQYSLHTKSHFIPEVTSYKGHFIPVTSYQSHLIRYESYQCTTYHAALHTKAISYQSPHTMRHFIPKSLHTSAPHTQGTSYQCF